MLSSRSRRRVVDLDEFYRGLDYLDDERRAYITDPEFVDRRYELPAVAELVARPGVVGVVRYVELPSFRPERLFTLVYRADRIEVSAVIGATWLWGSLPDRNAPAFDPGDWEEEEPFDARRAWRGTAVVALPCEACPPVLRSWESVRAAAAEAASCSTIYALDAVSYRHQVANRTSEVVYRHRVADRTSEAVAAWYNPNRRDHAAQVALIKAYVSLLGHASVYPR